MSTKRTVSNLISANKLEEAVPVSSKKDFKEAIKKYCGKLLARVKEQNPERVDVVKKALPVLTKELLEKFSSLTFYATEDDGYELDGMLVVHETINSDVDKGDQPGDVCRLYAFKDGLVEEKV